MLRTVICAPGREPGPACRLDLDHHLVLSFRAFVDDVQLSSWDGLTGVYPRGYSFCRWAVIDEYTKVELRGLASVPLKLHPKRFASWSSAAPNCTGATTATTTSCPTTARWKP